MNPWINADVIMVKKWSKNLFSIFLNASIASFYAGQFTKLAVYNMQHNKIQRAYSYVNPPNHQHIEIYITRVLNGELSNYLYNLQPGENILIKKYASGFFTLNEIPSCKKLWMFATGTAIGPYCSILQDIKATKRFDHIFLIHAVRYHHELNYLPLMKKLQKKYAGKLYIQTIVSREEHSDSLRGRIPDLLKNQKIEKKIGHSLEDKNSHVMLCGNPGMVKDTCFFLINNKKMKKNLRRIPGQITTENYW